MSASTLIGRIGYQPVLIAAVERVIERREMRRRQVEWLMSHDGPNGGRGSVDRAPNSVNATTIQASPRKRVADSFDARSASERTSERPYSSRQFAKDVRNVRRPRRETFSRLTVPTWYIALIDAAALDLDGRAAALAPFKRETVTVERERTTRQSSRTASSKARERADRMAAMAPSNNGNPDA